MISQTTQEASSASGWMAGGTLGSENHKEPISASALRM